ncbi:hypothetical protein C4559_06290 [Candidatus Microgenomates bacterium]|nr:MAG: hypothetical protein C4559_06290 [Candidatus Microgenomates bacterium]
MKKTKKLKRKKINYKLIIKAELLMLGVFFIFGIYQLYAYVPAVREAVAMATTVMPETFTELYFENHLSLPNKIVYYKENDFKFTIHNLENKDMEYPYEVYIDLNGEKQIIEQSSISIKKNGYKTISEDFTIIYPTARVKVIVNLINKNQQIAFWLEGGM